MKQSMYRSVVVGVPTIANAAGFASLISDLRSQIFLSVHLIAVANSPQAREYVAAQRQVAMGLAGGLAEMSVELPDRNLGVAGSWNRMAERAFASGYDRIILANDDIRLTSNEVLRAFADYPGGILLSEHRFSFFTLGREAFRQVGPFDEKFHPAYFEDIDYVRRCRLAGVPLWKCPARLGIAHEARSTSRDPALANLLAALTPYNRQRYMRKWGGDPGNETYTRPFDGRPE